MRQKVSFHKIVSQAECKTSLCEFHIHWVNCVHSSWYTIKVWNDFWYLTHACHDLIVDEHESKFHLG
jgi:hypothetical protein